MYSDIFVKSVPVEGRGIEHIHIVLKYKFEYSDPFYNQKNNAYHLCAVSNNKELNGELTNYDTKLKDANGYNTEELKKIVNSKDLEIKTNELINSIFNGMKGLKMAKEAPMEINQNSRKSDQLDFDMGR